MTPSYAHTPGYCGREWTPSLGCASPGLEQRVDGHSQPTVPANPIHIHLVEEVRGSSEQRPDGIGYNYLAEWRITLNHRVIAKDTEQDLSEPPSILWPRIK